MAAKSTKVWKLGSSVRLLDAENRHILPANRHFYSIISSRVVENAARSMYHNIKIMPTVNTKWVMSSQMARLYNRAQIS